MRILALWTNRTRMDILGHVQESRYEDVWTDRTPTLEGVRPVQCPKAFAGMKERQASPVSDRSSFLFIRNRQTCPIYRRPVAHGAGPSSEHQRRHLRG